MGNETRKICECSRPATHIGIGGAHVCKRCYNAEKYGISGGPKNERTGGAERLARYRALRFHPNSLSETIVNP